MCLVFFFDNYDEGVMRVKESDLQKDVINELKKRLPGVRILKNDANYLQGYPDLTIHYRGMFALLETKRNSKSSHRPNQDFYIDETNATNGFARFINKDNRDVILDELEQSFKTRGVTCISKP